MSNNTPLWLELRKEYIDDNFDKLLGYLRDSGSLKQNDAFYLETISLLKVRVLDLLKQLSARTLFDEAEDDSVTIFNIRLLASFLLAVPGDELSVQAYVGMMSEMKTLNPKFSEQIIKTTMDRLVHEKVLNIGFAWNDIIDFKDEIFTFHVINNSQFTGKLKNPLVYERYGTAFLNSKGLFLTCEKRKDALNLQTSGASSLDTGIGVSVRTTSSTKLKVSDAHNLPAMDDFARDFIMDAWKTQKKLVASSKMKYIDGDEVVIRITEIDRKGVIHVETVDEKHEKIEGTIHFGMQNFVYYDVYLFAKYLSVGDYLKATLMDSDKKKFSIQDEFIRYVTEDCRKEYPEGEVSAKLVKIAKNFLVWINERGTHLYSKFSADYKEGDYAVLEIAEFCTGKEYGKIHTYLPDTVTYEDNFEIDVDEVKRDCIMDFAKETKAPADTFKKDEDQELSPVILRLLSRMFFSHQKGLLKPSDRYCFLANARIMAEMTNDDLGASYIKFASSYLRVLVQFVNNEPISKIDLEPEPEYRDARDTLIRLAIVQLLKEYGKKENSEVLARAIADYEDTLPILARIARLVQTANSMQGTLSDASINVIKREIIKTLSLETENDTDLEDGGTYLGVESGTLEFKTSIVYPSNNNMQPDPIVQEKNVLRGICAFLNSTSGGTLYLGVNDQGYIIGIENDMKYLRMESMDSYMRYVQDRAKHYFDLDGIVYIRIEPQYDGRVLAIHVEPHPYRVVELNGVAYIRVNAESREMPDSVKQELIARKVFKDKNKAAAISQLQHAMSQKKCVILHNYASSNSGSLKDRFVEAYDVLPDDDLITCYDRDTASAKKIKVFKISRIGWVEVLDEPWKFPLSHDKVNVDAFHMSGDKGIKVSLELDLLAKNLLTEEFPKTKEDIAASRGNDNQWFYNGIVFNVTGIARFYLGLAEHIKILNAPELIAYIKEYKEKYLTL